MSNEMEGVLYTCRSEADNPFDRRTQPQEHAVWRDACRLARLELDRSSEDQAEDCALKEESAPEQYQFALVWRPFLHPFRLRVTDVVCVDGNRLGRIIRVTDCAAVVLMNSPAREFTTRFDKKVRFQPPAVTVHISANSETEILNRKARNRQAKRGRE